MMLGVSDMIGFCMIDVGLNPMFTCLKVKLEIMIALTCLFLFVLFIGFMWVFPLGGGATPPVFSWGGGFAPAPSGPSVPGEKGLRPFPPQTPGKNPSVL